MSEMGGAHMTWMGGAFRLKWVGHLPLRWVGQLWQSVLLFFWEIWTLVFRGLPFPVITWPWVLVPLNSWPVGYYKGDTTPHLSFALWSAQLFGWHSYCYGHSQCNKLLNKFGWGQMGGVIIIWVNPTLASRTVDFSYVLYIFCCTSFHKCNLTLLPKTLHALNSTAYGILKITLGHTNFTTSGAHDVLAITSPQKNDLCNKELWDRPKTLEEISLGRL